MKAIESLNKKLKKAKGHERSVILQGVYKQLVTSRKGREAKGEFRTLIEDISRQAYYFVKHVANQMDECELSNHASRLRDRLETMPSVRNIREYLDDMKFIARLNEQPLKGESFYTQVLERGYKTFEQVGEAIRKGEFPDKLFELGFYCNDGIVSMLVNVSKDTGLEKEAERMVEIREIENRMLSKISAGADEIGYSLKEQEQDREEGMSKGDIQARVERMRYISDSIGSALSR